VEFGVGILNIKRDLIDVPMTLSAATEEALQMHFTGQKMRVIRSKGAYNTS
jgi:hypothetical protein